MDTLNNVTIKTSIRLLAKQGFRFPMWYFKEYFSLKEFAKSKIL